MKHWVRRTLALLVCAMMTAMPALAEEEVRAEVIPLPEEGKGTMVDITATEDPMLGPSGSGYLFNKGDSNPYGYADPSITVNIGTGRIHQTNYMYARIKLSSPYQIRVAATEDSLAKVTSIYAAKLATRVKSVVAVNGVLAADRTTGGVGARLDGPVKLQGVWKRPSETASESKIAKWRAEEGQDTLVIDDEGDLILVSGETWGDIYDEIEEMGDAAVNAFCFGPALVIDGQPQYGYYSRGISSSKYAQRMAICQTGKLEYMVITSEGPEQKNSKGLKLDQFVELLASFPDIRFAYNLDGGSSSTLVFRKGNEKWAKVNCPSGSKERVVRDIIYFASAWQPSKKGGVEALPGHVTGEAK